MELNQIEKVLKTKATRELQIIVEHFTSEIAELCDKYKGGVDHTWLSLPCNSLNAETINGKFDVEHIRLKDLKQKLEYILNDAFLDKMINEKAKELVKKLDIL